MWHTTASVWSKKRTKPDLIKTLKNKYSKDLWIKSNPVCSTKEEPRNTSARLQNCLQSKFTSRRTNHQLDLICWHHKQMFSVAFLLFILYIYCFYFCTWTQILAFMTWSSWDYSLWYLSYICVHFRDCAKHIKNNTLQWLSTGKKIFSEQTAKCFSEVHSQYPVIGRIQSSCVLQAKTHSIGKLYT